MRTLPTTRSGRLATGRVQGNREQSCSRRRSGSRNVSGGRSSVWLWRQVVAALAFTIGKEICGHKLLTIESRWLIAGEVSGLRLRAPWCS